MNLICTVALGTVLAFEMTEPGTMARPPRPRGRPIPTGELVWRIAFTSVLMACGAFGVFFRVGSRGLPVEVARTMVVNAIVVMEIAHLFSARHVCGSSLTWRGALGTPAVLTGLRAVVVAQLAFTYLPPLQAPFGTAAIGVAEAAVIFGVGLALLLTVEAETRIRLRRR